ncbi:MAG: DUF1211 domain-containing protein [Armatimonadetes bacterium]|nr:DUF1211 domain-containing protein [Armatimonadota bacterium]
MSSQRLEAFSDAVIAIIMTIMVLELRIPHGADLDALRPMLPKFLFYLMSFAYLGIYWNNHHHMIHVAKSTNGAILWANMHLLFWLSLVPATTAWMGENGGQPLPAAVYGVTLLLPAIAYFILQQTIIRHQGPDSQLRRMVGRDLKGKFSPLLYALGIGLSFVSPPAAYGLYALVALIWIVPDRRIEAHLHQG